MKRVTKTDKLIAALNPNVNGKTAWLSVEQISDIVGFPVSGNGCSHFQNDRCVGKYYDIEKRYATNPRRVTHIRFTGNK